MPFMHLSVEQEVLDVGWCVRIISVDGSSNLPVALRNANPELGAHASMMNSMSNAFLHLRHMALFVSARFVSRAVS